jgi:hypothetical protein
MKSFGIKLAAMLPILLAEAVVAQTPIAIPDTPPIKPPSAPLTDEPGVSVVGELRPGEQWMTVRMYLDKNGRPDKCRTIETNITSKDKRFWICQTMMHQWHTEPIMENGVAVKGSVVRRFVLRDQ